MKNLNSTFLITLITTLFFRTAHAQTQVVRGTRKDAQADYPLIGATVIVIGSDPIKGATTDFDGKFKIQDVPAGRQTLLVQYIGNKTQTIPNV